MKDHIFKKNLPRKNQILEVPVAVAFGVKVSDWAGVQLSFKHSMIEHIVNSVEMIKDLAKSDGILKDLRGKIKDEKKFEFELLQVIHTPQQIRVLNAVAGQIHKTIEGIETLRDRLHRMVTHGSHVNGSGCVCCTGSRSESNFPA